MFSDETQTKKLSDVPWQVSTFQLRRPRVCFSALTQELLSNAYKKVSRCSPTHIGLTGRRQSQEQTPLLLLLWTNNSMIHLSSAQH